MSLQIHVWLNEKAQEDLMKDKIMPTRDQIKNFLYKYKKDNKCQSNTIEDTIELVERNQLQTEWVSSNEPWTINKPFYCGFKKDLNNKPIINPGTFILPLRLVFSIINYYQVFFPDLV